MARALLLAITLSIGCVTLPPPKDDCELARRIFQHCGVSLPLLEGQACLGVPLGIARCVVKVGNDCDELAAITNRLDDCLASANQTLPPLEDVPLSGEIDAGADASTFRAADAAMAPADLATPPDAASPPWPGFAIDDALTAGEQRVKSTPQLAPGTYRFTLTGSGDADLYVRIGLQPTLSLYDCRPFLSDSNEACTVTLPTPDKIVTLVRSEAGAASYHLVAQAVP